MVAVNVAPVAASDKVTPVTVTVEVPLAILPVVVPPIVPPPVLLKVKPDAAPTLTKLPLKSAERTITENPVPDIGLEPPFTEVITYFNVGTISPVDNILAG